MLRQRQKRLVHRILGLRAAAELPAGQGQQTAPAGGVYVLELPGLPGILYGLDIEQHDPSSLLAAAVQAAVCAPVLRLHSINGAAERIRTTRLKKLVLLWKKDAGASFSGKTVHTYTEGDAGYTMTNIL